MCKHNNANSKLRRNIYFPIWLIIENWFTSIDMKIHGRGIASLSFLFFPSYLLSSFSQAELVLLLHPIIWTKLSGVCMYVRMQPALICRCICRCCCCVMWCGVVGCCHVYFFHRQADCAREGDWYCVVLCCGVDTSVQKRRGFLSVQKNRKQKLKETQIARNYTHGRDPRAFGPRTQEW